MTSDTAPGTTSDLTSGATSGARPGGAAAGTVTVRFFAAAQEAAGVEEESAAVAAGAVLADVPAAATARHPDLAPALRVCSYLVDSVSANPTTTVPGGAVVDVLPPFAGG